MILCLRFSLVLLHIELPIYAVFDQFSHEGMRIP